MELSEQTLMENKFYYTNFLTLFNKSKELGDIRLISQQATQTRVSNQNCFDSRTDELLSIFHNDKSEQALDPHLKGWDLEVIYKLRAQYGGVLIALFHYGPHRHVLMDLACMGIDITSPIAKKAYWKQYELRDKAPGNIAHCMQLLEVEKETVGRELFLGLRAKRVGVIYVDGNMGPQTYQAGESTVIVDFFDRKIKVKAGITRLAQAFNYPILPAFTAEMHDGPHVQFGRPILPRDKAEQTKAEWQLSTMQHLYKTLEQQVSIDPSQWEYAMCLHRWLAKDPNQGGIASNTDKHPIEPLDHEDIIQINRKNVSVIERGEKSFWVDVNAEKGYMAPTFMPHLFKSLEQNEGVRINDLLSQSEDSDQHQKILKALEQLHRDQLIVTASQNKKVKEF